MGNCKYCGEKVGFLKSAHEECEQKRNEQAASLQAQAKRILNRETDSISGDFSYLKPDEKTKILLGASSLFLDLAIEDGGFSEEEEAAIKTLSIAAGDIDLPDEIRLRVVRWSNLRSLIEGKELQPRISVEGLPFALKKGEVILDAVQDTKYYEYKSRVPSIGWISGRQRISKGFSVNFGRLLAGPPQQTALLIGGGTFILTTQRIFQATGSKLVTIPIKKIEAFQGMSDGLLLQRSDRQQPVLISPLPKDVVLVALNVIAHLQGE